MDGETVKYQYYPANKRSFITIPVSMARGLNWLHGDDIGIVIDIKDTKKGLFLFKKEKE